MAKSFMMVRFPMPVLAAIAAGCFAGCSPSPQRDRLQAVPLADVVVKGHVGDLQNEFFKHRVLSDFAKDKIWKEAHEAFAHPDDDVFNHGIGMWKGEFWGKLMISACRVAEYTHDTNLRDFLHNEALSLIQYQQEDGYLGTYVNKEYVKPLPLAEQQRRVGWPCPWNWNLWCRKYTLWGLLSAYRLTGDRVLLEAADRAMFQQIAMLRRLNLRLAETGTTTMRGLPPCSILKPLVILYRETQKPLYLEYASEIVASCNDPTSPAVQFADKLATGKPIQDWYPSENGHWGKAYEMMSLLDGFVEYYRETGNKDALAVATKMCDRIWKDELNLCLSVGYNDQFWGARRHLNGISEPCDAIHWMRLNHDLYLVTGEAKYVDRIEETFYNAFLAGVRPDGTWGGRCVRSHTRHQKAPPQSGMTLQHCCVNNMPRGFMDVAQTIAARDRDGTLVIALYHDASFAMDDDEVEIRGNFPIHSEVQLEFHKKVAGKVRLRKPAWSKNVIICGGSVCGRVLADGWFDIDVPQGRSVWSLKFDMNPRIVRSDRERVAAYDAKSPLVTRWARNDNSEFGERDLMPHLFKEPRAQIMWGPLLLAKSVKVGCSEKDILSPTAINDGGWSLSLKSVETKAKVWGAWRMTLEKQSSRLVFGVCDYPSAAIWSADKIEFSTLY